LFGRSLRGYLCGLGDTVCGQPQGATRRVLAEGGKGPRDKPSKCGIYVLDVNEFAAEAAVPKCRLEDVVVAGWTQVRARTRTKRTEVATLWKRERPSCARSL